LLPSEPDHPSARKRARELLQRTVTCRPRQNHALPLPRPTRTVSCPPLDTAGAPSPAYKRAPCWPEKIHTTSLSPLDIVSHGFASWFELAGAGRAPGCPRVPGVPEPPSSCRQYKVDEDSLRRRTAPRRRLPSLPRRAPPPCCSQPPPPVSSL
jgi:hypothetical protein